MAFRFVHTADLHLDSPLRSLAMRNGDLAELIGDATRYAAPLYGSGWEAADLQHWFGAPTSALSVDDNVVKLTIKPAPRVGELARIEFDPKTSAPQLDNSLRTVPDTWVPTLISTTGLSVPLADTVCVTSPCSTTTSL